MLADPIAHKSIRRFGRAIHVEMVRAFFIGMYIYVYILCVHYIYIQYKYVNKGLGVESCP